MQRTLKVSELDIDVISLLYVAGHDEYGREYYAETYVVRATDGKGNRWLHNRSFPGCVSAWTEEDGYPVFSDIRPQARASAMRLLDKILRTGQINLDYWTEERPVYGSRAYSDYGMQEEVEEERAKWGFCR